MTIQRRSTKGFTVVELLAVLVTIGILAGITIVSYGAWQRRAAEDQVRSELFTAMNSYSNYRNSNGSYPSSIENAMSQQSNNVTLYVRYASNNMFCIIATSKTFGDIKYVAWENYKEPKKVDASATPASLCDR